MTKFLSNPLKTPFIKARVDERHNYLEVESNKFLKFRQDYAELDLIITLSTNSGAWLQTALSDTGSGEGDGDDPKSGNLSRAQSVFNLYKKRVDDLSLLKVKLDNVITYGRDLLIHLSPAAAKQLTSDLSILQTLWEKLDVEVRSRFSEAELCLEGLLKLQDKINEVNVWLETLTTQDASHEAGADSVDDFGRHATLFQNLNMQFETQGMILQMTRQLSHQLMGSLDSSYEAYVSAQYEMCTAKWTEHSTEMARKAEVCAQLHELRLSLAAQELMLGQFEGLLKDLDGSFRDDGYGAAFEMALGPIETQISSAAQMIASIEAQCKGVSDADSICACGLGVALGTLSSKIRTRCDLNLEMVAKYQVQQIAQLESVEADLDLRRKEVNDMSLRLFKSASTSQTELISNHSDSQRPEFCFLGNKSFCILGNNEPLCCSCQKYSMGDFLFNAPNPTHLSDLWRRQKQKR
eukprot:sb/3464450/